MDVREAVDGDASDVAELLDAPTGAAERLLRERTVVVAEDDGLVGVLAFEVDDVTVHVTRLAGDPDAVERLLDEPVAFATREGFPVELLLPESNEGVDSAVETRGFERVGSGPRFGAEATVRYRLETT